ncbi:PIG-L deacetylase family protein [Halomonas sp. PAMB 3264]|uniref:PIG-L deacetylase family protein n=1 Tax=Halomonas sp. PAMB 3264 TaxID=3075222 RepID=UPI0028A1584C|nr:PIG-L deacetylase family protein [Halomonas sp. PAMB 3264]WNL43439.1 PIG-L deacetylase family protein [Halomonas sp. PAMB 3264]
MREAWYVPYQAQPLEGERVLVLAPHPDDEVFGCGGALAQLAAQGATIQVIIATQGAGAERRLAESTEAAALLGYPAPINWDFADRGLEQAIEALTERLLNTLLDFEPDLLLAPANTEMHPDHRAACDAALKAGARYASTQDTPLSIALYEIGVPLPANQLVDISAVFERKARAMQCFDSQLSEQRYADQIGGLNHYRSYTLGLGVTQAEAFHVIKATRDGVNLTLPSVQDQALWRCEAALEQMREKHAQAQSALNQKLDALSARQQETQTALAQSEERRRHAEQMLETIYATRGWRWLSRLKSLLGRG